MPTRSRSSSALLVLAGVALCSLATSRTTFAAWPAFGRAVSSAVGDQVTPAITSDGANGAIIAWVDFRCSPVNIFARRVLSSGELDPAWPVDGRALETNPVVLGNETEDPGFTTIIPDGSGGAIVTWQEGRSSLTGSDIFAQHVLASGAVDGAWPANGAVLCVIEGSQRLPTTVSDGAGGAIVTWMDNRRGADVVDIYAQHVMASGLVDPRWPVNGLAVSTAAGPQALPTIVEDRSGGAIITWTDGRNAASTFDIYAQHVLNSGVVDPSWTVNGIAVCTANGEQFEPKIVSDGAHGAVLAWFDARSGTNRIFAQHVLATGAVDAAWPINGRAVSAGVATQESPRPVSDGAGGVIIIWQERVNGVLGILAQHLRAAGVADPAWPAGGRVLSAPNADQSGAGIVPDGTGGAIVAWVELADIRAQHIAASGALDPSFSGGRTITGLPGLERSPALVATGGGGAIVAWQDSRRGSDDIFAFQVLQAVTGAPETPAPGFSFERPGPNPATSVTLLRFSLPRDAEVRLRVYDAAGRRVSELVSGTQPAGVHAITWDFRDARGARVGAGVYFVRLEVGQHKLIRKLVHSR